MNTFTNFSIELWLSLSLIAILTLFIYYYYKNKKNLHSKVCRENNHNLFDVHKELDTIIQSVHSTVDQKNVQIKYYSTLEQNIFIEGNKSKFHHALFDLVKKGLDASHNGTIEVAVHEMLSSILIVIEHNGRSLSKEQIKQLTNSLPTTDLMRTMKGKIEIVSQQGQGTILSLIIPKASRFKPNTI